mmetsp:Transcript_57774/g.164135  ORF Transcript_57774/g.164135 Transcript_57774/m.164135 type:complete len:254 (-) Transcript_57774:65-826(-)
MRGKPCMALLLPLLLLRAALARPQAAGAAARAQEREREAGGPPLLTGEALALVQSALLRPMTAKTTATETTTYVDPDATTVPIWMTPTPYVHPGNCSTEDFQKMEERGGGNDPNGFPHMIARCSSISFKLDQDKTMDINYHAFLACIGSEIAMGRDCEHCFGDYARFWLEDCIEVCFGTQWCQVDCLNCKEQFRPQLQECTGGDPPKAPPCEAEHAPPLPIHPWTHKPHFTIAPQHPNTTTNPAPSTTTNPGM